ncbi:MAG: hypothetical protein QXX17_08145 [Conexivisphaerales archaeon]
MRNQDLNLPDLNSLSAEIQELSRELATLTSVHAPLSSKLAALIFRYYELYRTCGSYAIAILGLEAENRTLCSLLGIIHDESKRQKEEELFDRYHGKQL